MKRWLVLGAAVSFTACNPDIPVTPDQSSKYSVAEFDPPAVVPTPNDLAFLDANFHPDTHLHVPSPPGTSDAQKEFNDDYLNLLDGFPMETPASVLLSRGVNPATVNPGTVRLVDITNPSLPVPITTASYSVSAVSDAGPAQILTITPDGGIWTRGHRYAVAVIGIADGGATGVKGAQGETVIGSSTWALVSSPDALVNCDGGTCKPTTSAIPTTEKDPKAQVAQQLAIAEQLEALRLSYAPLISALSSAPPPAGVPRGDIAVVWTFTITSAAEVTFDPAHNIIPFPNDLLNPTGKQVALPVPPDAGALTQLYEGLNTLDGFSTTAPIVSEFGLATGPLMQGTLANDPSNIGLGLGKPFNFFVARSPDGGTTPQPLAAHSCLSCPQTGSPTLLDGGVKPDTLAIIPDLPLTERTTYGAYVTTDMKDSSSKNVIPTAAFALFRSSKPLVDSNNKSTVSALSDDVAQQLERARAGYQDFFTGLAAQGLPRKKVALAWVFTTQSTVSALARLHAAPSVAPGLPFAPVYVTGAYSAQIKSALAGMGIVTTNIGTIYIGGIVDLFALTGETGTFQPNLAGAVPRVIPFIMTTPVSAAPASGYPVTIFGHGLTGNRKNGYAIANALGFAGQAMIAIDVPWHGDRNTCTGFGAYLDAASGSPPGTFSDDAACATGGTCSNGRCLKASGASACVANDPGANGDAACQIQDQGACLPSNKCEGSTFGTSALGGQVPVSGWNLLNLSNLFATRDNFRQQVISHGQLARVILGTGGTSLGARSVALDPTKISYAGQSLGGILGTLYTSVAPEIGNAVLNVPGADLVLILLTSPAFAAQQDAFIAGLAAQGIEQNSPLYDQFLGIAKWILDPADPGNAGYYVAHGANFPPPLPNIGGNRRAFIQWIVGDGVVPNALTTELARAASGEPTQTGIKDQVGNLWMYQFNGTSTPYSFNLNNVAACERHGFLLKPPSATCGGAPSADGVTLTGNAQTQAVGFISGAAPF
jgi:hypothetical protein